MRGVRVDHTSAARRRSSTPLGSLRRRPSRRARHGQGTAQQPWGLLQVFQHAQEERPPSDHSGYSSEDDFEGPTLFGSILRTIMAGGAVVAIAILVRPRDATRA